LKTLDDKAPERRKAIDQACYDLAESYLGVFMPGCDPEDIWTLADVIQVACEEACQEIKDRSPDPPSAA
jgi:hypothetical protein